MVRWTAAHTLCCTITFVSFAIGCCSSSEAEFSYVVFPVREKKQYDVALEQVRSLSELSLCGWVVHNQVFVDRQSAFITLQDGKGNQLFRLYLLQSGVYFSVTKDTSDDVTLPAPNLYWYHLCVTWDSSTGNYRLYRDGNVQFRGSGLAKGQVLEGISTLTLGNKSSDSYVFSGRISDFHLYSKALNSTQVRIISCFHKCTGCHTEVSWSDIESEVESEDEIYQDENPCYLPPPTGLRVELHGPTAILASWSSSPFSHQFQWYIIMITPVDDQAAIPATSTTLKEHYLLKDLEEATSYKVQVTKKSRCGYKSWSEAVTIRTLSVPDPIEGLEVTNKTNSSISISWDAITEQQIQSYRIIISESYEGAVETHQGVLPGVLTYTFPKLLPNTWYTIKVAGYNSELGLGDYSAISTKTLSNSVPEVLVKVDVDIQPYFLVKISWRLIDSDLTNILYKIAIKKEQDKEKRVLRKRTYEANSGVLVVDGANTPYIEIRTSLHSLTIEGLLKHTPYHVTVSLCPDPISECQHASNTTRFIIGQAEHYYYQQFYDSDHTIQETDINGIISEITARCGSTVNYTPHSISPTSFIGTITFYNEDGSNVIQGLMWFHLQQGQCQTISLQQGTVSLVAFQFTPVNPNGYCHFERHHDKGRGNFTWPYVRSGSLISLPCNTSRPDWRVTRERACQEEVWEGAGDYAGCPYTESTSGDLQRLIDIDITNVEVAVEVSKALSEVTQGEMNEESIGLAADAINQVVAAGANPNISYNTQVAENLVGALGNIQSLDRTQLSSEGSASSSQTIVTNIETYCLKLKGEDSTLLNVGSEDLKLAVVKPEGGTGIYIETQVESTEKMSISYKDNVHTEALLHHIGVEVPSSLLKSNSNVLSVLYKDKSLFQSAERSLSEEQYHIPTVSLSINTLEQDTPLKDKVTFSLNFKKTPHQAVCVYWDTKAKDWSVNGVEVVYRDETSLVCKTSHLTSFSALLLPAQNDLILSILTQIGTSISIMCLFTTVLLLYIVRCVRECLSTKIHINFSLALFLALLFFLINANTSQPGVYCKILAGLTHYFFLCTFLWMAVEAVGLYRAVVLVFTSGSNKPFLVWSCVLAWGLPGVVVVVLGSVVDLQVYQIHINLGMCWLTRKWMYGSFFGPLVLVILFNSAVFFRVLWTIIRNKNSKAKAANEKKGQKLVELRIIFSIMTLLGLTWIFGILQIIAPHKVLEYLFALTNTLQGVAVFVFYCLFNSSIRTALWRLVHGQAMNVTKSTSSTIQKKKKKRKISIKKATKNKMSIVKLHIDGNPFAFSFGSTTTEGESTLRKLDKKNWKKLKKNDIQHPNVNLGASQNGAVILKQTATSASDKPNLTTLTNMSCNSPSNSPDHNNGGLLSRESSPSSRDSDSPARGKRTYRASPDMDSKSNDVLIKPTDSSEHFENNMDTNSKEDVDSKDIFIINKNSIEEMGPERI